MVALGFGWCSRSWVSGRAASVSERVLQASTRSLMVAALLGSFDRGSKPSA